jgi:hypothetical protein
MTPLQSTLIFDALTIGLRRQVLLADDPQHFAADLDNRLDIFQQIERQRVVPPVGICVVEVPMLSA